jgi:hypothetical protein
LTEPTLLEISGYATYQEVARLWEERVKNRWD